MDKPFNPNAGEKISRAETKKMIGKYKEKHADRLQGYYFGRENYERLLALPGAAGIMIMNGLDDDGNHVNILVAVDSTGTALTADDSERGQACPPYCSNI
jgi:hypothetical protein